MFTLNFKERFANQIISGSKPHTIRQLRKDGKPWKRPRTRRTRART